MTATIVQVVQGSEAWLAHRRNLFNASETPAVLGISPWQTPYPLWLLKTGRAEAEVTAPMRRGTALEPQARLAYEEKTGARDAAAGAAGRPVLCLLGGHDAGRRPRSSRSTARTVAKALSFGRRWKAARCPGTTWRRSSTSSW
jgi:hypothetical protein